MESHIERYITSYFAILAEANTWDTIQKLIIFQLYCEVTQPTTAHTSEKQKLVLNALLSTLELRFERNVLKIIIVYSSSPVTKNKLLNTLQTCNGRQKIISFNLIGQSSWRALQ